MEVILLNFQIYCRRGPARRPPVGRDVAAPIETNPVPGPEEDPSAAGAAQPEGHHQQLGLPLRAHRGLQRG